MISIKGYIIDSEIGKGGFGKVYSASVKDITKFQNVDKVAIKVIEKEQLKNDELRDRIAAEVSIHSRLSHPSIVKLYDYFEDSKRVYLVMELCKGGDLFNYLLHRKKIEYPTPALHNSNTMLSILPDPEIRNLMLQLGRAVRYLHQNSIIHRDLKLKNLVISAEMDIKLIDFGLATTVKNDPSDPTTFCGTQNYISPEVAARKPYGLAIDLWSLGILLVTLKTGFPPSNSELNQGYGYWLSRFKNESLELADLAQKLLTKDPNDRISIIDYFNHPFFNPIQPCKPLLNLNSLKSNNLKIRSLSQDNSIPDIACFQNTHADIQNLSNAIPKSTLIDAITDIFGDKARNSEIEPNNQFIQSGKKLSLDGHFHAHRKNKTRSSLINTTRLSPIKQKTKHAVIEILSDGRVKSEFLGDSHILVFDPLLNCVLQFQRDATLLLKDKADSITPLNYECMSSELSRKTKYVLKFIELVRSKTCKIFLKTPQAKASLMENLPIADIHVSFYNNIRVAYFISKEIAEIRIPTSSDLPDEIQRLPISIPNSSDSVSIPKINPEIILDKLIPVIKHVEKCLEICTTANKFIDDWISGSNLRSEDYTGDIKFPVQIKFDTNFELFIPEGLSRKILVKKKNSRMNINQRLSPHNDDGLIKNFRNINNDFNRYSSLNVSSLNTKNSNNEYDNTFLKYINENEKINNFEKKLNSRHSNGINSFKDSRLDGMKFNNEISSFYSKKTSINEGQIINADKSAFILNVGWCFSKKLSNSLGEIYVFTILFIDGTRLEVNSDSDCVTYFENPTGAVNVLDYSGESYKISSTMPEIIKEKLKRLPDFLSLIGIENV
ncbi:Serine/threonine-protein kinase PLK4 [Smittium culicis]|uniref:Serine/threonine-protein kinase PLK4 n=1 Tax=Smittium culicis TaxID=133412 RepID=A0A1R1XQ69_9FUNG|nr:Serine/threonine-protein kinase PLK4 [Smittium culicis]